MKHRVISVLKSKRGVSIVMGLLIFMLCALAGASALMMATANVGRYSHAQDDQQPYYSVTSAAVLMMDLLDGTKYTSAEINYLYERKWEFKSDGSTPSSHPQTSRYSLNIWDDAAFESAGVVDYKTEVPLYWKLAVNTKSTATEEEKNALRGTMKGDNHFKDTISLFNKVRDYADRLVPFLGVEKEWYSTVNEHIDREYFRPQKEEYLNYSFTITPQDAAYESEFGKVECRLIMQESFDLILSFVYKSNTESDSSYAVNVYWEAEVDQKTDSKPPVTEYTTDGQIGSMTTSNSKVITVTWKKENATLSRGEAV